MDNSGIYVGLDIGTTSIKVVIAEYIKNQMNIIGYGNTRSAGLNRGVIVDIDQVVLAIKNAVKQAEEKASRSITEVSVGVPANLLAIERCKGIIAVGNDDGSSREITDDDVRKVTEASLVHNLPPERAVIDIIPDEFIVDGFNGIKDPRGMVGVRMEMNGVKYTGPKTILHNIKKCVQKAGLRVRDLVVAPLALANIALSDGEQDFGAILVDLGGGQTTAAVIHDHKLKYTYVDQEGGNFVTRDISVVLNTSLENAELLKQNYGFADATMASDEERFPVKVVGKQEPMMITEKHLAEIIEARMRQIFEKLAADLNHIHALNLPGGVVITGGLASLPGVAELAAKILGVHVSIYTPQEMNLRIPAYSQVIGIVDYITRESEINQIVRHTVDGTYPTIAANKVETMTNEPQINTSTREDFAETEDDIELKSGWLAGLKKKLTDLFNGDDQ
ncbi:cell division protein FtsA [Ligilactobacillus sp. WC1T17]|uniref:Cell division protein FtsA n=1 Tax=Ligilactobacillus ruminis TaxID=1623 RepID=A0ABY1AAW6_9LACO|nr:cell division protein FtsA [Ligilactobacillus ruminis]